MIEVFVIVIVVLGAVGWALRAAYRAVKQTGGCTSCSSASECPLVNGSIAPDCTGLPLPPKPPDTQKSDVLAPASHKSGSGK